MRLKHLVPRRLAAVVLFLPPLAIGLLASPPANAIDLTTIFQVGINFQFNVNSSYYDICFGSIVLSDADLKHPSQIVQGCSGSVNEQLPAQILKKAMVLRFMAPVSIVCLNSHTTMAVPAATGTEISLNFAENVSSTGTASFNLTNPCDGKQASIVANGSFSESAGNATYSVSFAMNETN